MMNETKFWTLIETAKTESNRGDSPFSQDERCERLTQALQEQLIALSTQEIIAFQAILYELMAVSYRRDLWGAAYLTNGGCSDDGFEYFRGWLIGQGQTVFENALADPDTLADVLDETAVAEADVECEAILYAAIYAYEEKTGKEMPYPDSAPYRLTGDEWTEDTLGERFPKLAAKVGW